MKRRVKYIGVLGVISVGFAVLGWRYYVERDVWHHMVHIARPYLYHFSVRMLEYMKEDNWTEFPQSEQELIDRNYLRKQQTPDGIEYYRRGRYFDANAPDNPEGWVLFSDIYGMFKISYGAKLDDITATDYKLYDKATGEQILLIRGPYPKQMEDDYVRVSYGWYSLLVEQAQSAGVSAEKTED